MKPNQKYADVITLNPEYEIAANKSNIGLWIPTPNDCVNIRMATLRMSGEAPLMNPIDPVLQLDNASFCRTVRSTEKLQRASVPGLTSTAVETRSRNPDLVRGLVKDQDVVADVMADVLDLAAAPVGMLDAQCLRAKLEAVEQGNRCRYAGFAPQVCHGGFRAPTLSAYAEVGACREFAVDVHCLAQFAAELAVEPGQ